MVPRSHPLKSVLTCTKVVLVPKTLCGACPYPPQGEARPVSCVLNWCPSMEILSRKLVEETDKLTSKTSSQPYFKKGRIGQGRILLTTEDSSKHED